jgi:uncharacterized protein (DUF2252 family)
MATTEAQRLTSAEREARGREARAKAPRSAHAAWQPAPDRPDPIDLLEQQAVSRVPELVPIRYGRMLASPFAFYRGAAYVMASDLARTPASGIPVQLCGDAHLGNFGGFAAPDRRLVFDINDFDETLPGPWEWDLKRLAASVAVAGREVAIAEKARRRIVAASVRAYRTTIRTLAPMRNLDVWYARVEADKLIERLRARASGKAVGRVERTVGRAQHKDSLRALRRLSESVNGRPQIVNDPPLVVPVRELVPAAEGDLLRRAMDELIRRYGASLRRDVRHILASYEFVDLAHKVVGVGSVGARAWIVLLMGRDGQDPLFLQAKEARASVLEPFLARSAFRNHGRRVVEGQRLLQPASDVMLGWTRATEIDGADRDYYIRQLWDWKLSADIDRMGSDELGAYGQLCGATLARGHARSGDRVAIAAYLGSGSRFDEAVADFAEAYADQNERDYYALVEAVQSGRIEAQPGV